MKKYNIILTDAARQDLLEAYLYYEEQSVDLGDRFLEKVEQRFTDLQNHPEYYSFIDRRNILRDVTVHSFSYVIVYKIINDSVRVQAVLHTRKSPL